MNQDYKLFYEKKAFRRDNPTNLENNHFYESVNHLFSTAFVGEHLCVLPHNNRGDVFLAIIAKIWFLQCNHMINFHLILCLRKPETKTLKWESNDMIGHNKRPLEKENQRMAKGISQTKDYGPFSHNSI